MATDVFLVNKMQGITVKAVTLCTFLSAVHLMTLSVVQIL
jgi:hypothetical protein